MSSYNYAEVPNQNLVCCICRSPFVDPCTTRTCCHTFCYECIARAIAISAQCPVDRCSLNVHDLVPADPLIRNLVDELVVECPNKEEGCSHTCQRMLLPVHLKDCCKYVEVPCSEGKCSKGVLRKDLASHTHAHDVSSEEDTGRSSPCLDSSSVDGRGEKSHESQESPQPSQEDARNFPDTTNSSYEALEVENARLRLRLSSLEGVVNTLQYELQAVRQALGPWYRTQDTDVRRGWGGTPQHQERYSSMNPAPSTSAIIDPLVLPQASSSRDENTSAASVSAPPLATSPTSPTAPSELVAGSDLSSYFPPAEEEDVYSPDFVRTHQAHRTTAMGSSQPRDSSHHPYRSGTQRIPLSQSQPASGHAYPPHAFSPTGYPAGPAPPHPDLGAISIPPLDPSVPLPSTLASLHGSIVSLAGALGALATTRAQDTLYTGEELRSMRAGIHGLRMQLHDVVTAHVASRDTSTPPLNTGVGGTMPDGVGSGGVALPGGPSAWMGYGPGPRPFGAFAFPHMPGGFTKL